VQKPIAQNKYEFHNGVQGVADSNPDEKIVVFWTKEIALPNFNRYRLRFRKVYSGVVKEMMTGLRKNDSEKYSRGAKHLKST